MSPEHNPADDVQPTKEEWEAFEKRIAETPLAEILKAGRESMQRTIYENARAPISPVECDWEGIGNNEYILRGHRTANSSGWELGLTKREHFAGLAMQTVIAMFPNIEPKNTAHWAVKCADELLIALESMTAQPIEQDDLEESVKPD